MADPAWVAWVDGCAAGCAVVLWNTHGEEAPAFEVAPDFAAVLSCVRQPVVIAVDMPIGLPTASVPPGGARGRVRSPNARPS
jgi:predicted RNase H-like nuclease